MLGARPKATRILARLERAGWPAHKSLQQRASTLSARVAAAGSCCRFPMLPRQPGASTPSPIKGAPGLPLASCRVANAHLGIREAGRQLPVREPDHHLGQVALWWRQRPSVGEMPAATHASRVKHIKGQPWKAAGPVGHLLTHLAGPCSSRCPRACTQAARIAQRSDPLAGSGPRGHALPAAHRHREGSRTTPQAIPCQGISSGVQIEARSTGASSQQR